MSYTDLIREAIQKEVDDKLSKATRLIQSYYAALDDEVQYWQSIIDDYTPGQSPLAGKYWQSVIVKKAYAQGNRELFALRFREFIPKAHDDDRQQ